MLATLAGLLALFAGLTVLLVPLLTPELSRQRDSFWGAVVLLLGLTLVTCSDRLVGAPMLAVICATLLMGRLSLEVSQGRWRQLSADEKQNLLSLERWQTNLQQLLAAAARLLAVGVELTGPLVRRLSTEKATTGSGKRWVRPEAPAPVGDISQPDPAAPGHRVVRSLSDVNGLILASSEAG